MPGVPCPQCEVTLSEVYDSRPGPGTIVRKRRCFNGHTFETRELVIGEIEPPRAATELLSTRIRAALRRGERPEQIAKRLGASLRYVKTFVRELDENTP